MISQSSCSRQGSHLRSHRQTETERPKDLMIEYSGARRGQCFGTWKAWGRERERERGSEQASVRANERARLGGRGKICCRTHTYTPKRERGRERKPRRERERERVGQRKGEQERELNKERDEKRESRHREEATSSSTGVRYTYVVLVSLKFTFIANYLSPVHELVCPTRI